MDSSVTELKSSLEIINEYNEKNDTNVTEIKSQIEEMQNKIQELTDQVNELTGGGA